MLDLKIRIYDVDFCLEVSKLVNTGRMNRINSTVTYCPMFGLLSMLVTGCIGTGTLVLPPGFLVGGGQERYVGGQVALRSWLSFSELEPISLDVIRSRVIEKYPIGTEFAPVMADATAARLGFLAYAVTEERSEVVVDPAANNGTCFFPAGNFHIFFYLDVNDRIIDVFVGQSELCV